MARSEARVCFIVNPFAGLGGPLARKGTDDLAVEVALKRKMPLISVQRGLRFVEAVASLRPSHLIFMTVKGVMGSGLLRRYGLSYEVIYEPAGWPTRAEDTRKAAKECLANDADIVVFVGGDGTARDVVSVVGTSKPVLGVPSGVKVFSSVFAISPEAAARALLEWVRSRTWCLGEVVDVDEEAYRQGKLSIKLYAEAFTPCSPLMVGSSKQPTPISPDEKSNMEAIAEYVVESMEPCTLYILGPGSTVASIAEKLGVKKTLLGVDVVHNGRLIASDVDEETLYRIVEEHVKRGGRVKIVVSPIGGQGFILGRGNQQISPRVLRLAGGKDALLIVATLSKMSRLKALRVDTGDPQLDRELKGYVRVVVDYGEEVVTRIE